MAQPAHRLSIVKPLASPQDYVDFMRSAVWTDMKADMLDLLEQKHLDIENAKEVDALRTLQGVTQAIRIFLDTPDRLKEEAEAIARQNNATGQP